MRVIAGKARHLLLKTLSGDDVRPTTDRIKETLFNMISGDIPGCRFLDLFGGSGAIGIEALSRGASVATFVECNRAAVECIRANLHSTKLEEDAKVYSGDSLDMIATFRKNGIKFDIIFMDPPYSKDIEKAAIIRLSDYDILDTDGIIIVEAKSGTDFSYVENSPFEIYKIKSYGSNEHVFLRKRTSDGE